MLEKASMRQKQYDAALQTHPATVLTPANAMMGRHATVPPVAVAKTKTLAAQVTIFLLGDIDESTLRDIHQRFGVQLTKTYVSAKVRTWKFHLRDFFRGAVEETVDSAGGMRKWDNTTKIQRRTLFEKLFDQAPMVISEAVWKDQKLGVDFDLIWSLNDQESTIWQNLCRERIVTWSELAWSRIRWVSKLTTAIRWTWQSLPTRLFSLVLTQLC
jgi:hypothetical protein